MKPSTSIDPGAEHGSSTPILGVVQVWLVCSVLLTFVTFDKIVPHYFFDVDDALRLQQVRDLLGGQGWFDMHQYRIAPPDGVAMHWTRVVDIPIALVILLVRPLLGQTQAELVAEVVVPLLTLLAAMLLVARLASRFFGRYAGMLGAGLVFLALPASLRMAPTRIDHHGWQFVLALAALNAMAARRAWVGGAVAGLAIALSLAISLEALPLAIIFGGVCALRLMYGQREWLPAYLVALALGSVAFFLGTRGFADIANHCDAISPIHVAVLLWSALGCVLLHPLRHRPPALSLFALGGIGIGAIAIMALAAPHCLTGDAFSALDPLVKQVWYQSVPEGLPVWRESVFLAGAMVFLPLFGLVACLRLYRAAENSEMRAWWRDMALLLGGAMLVGIFVSRASAVACLFATIPSAWQIKAVMVAWQRERILLRRLGWLVLFVALALPSWPLLLASKTFGRRVGTVQKLSLDDCDVPRFAAAFDSMKRVTVLTGLDMGPLVIEASQAKVVATGHHRANVQMRDVIAAWLGPDYGARAVMEKYNASIVAICAQSPETRYYLEHAPDGFAAHLVAGKAPAWLEPLPAVPKNRIMAWRVRPAPAPHTAR